MLHPYTILIILAIAMVFFIWGRFRYDVVALIALMLGVATRSVDYHHVYDGLSNPAVITVACVMIISHAITESGILTIFVNKISRITYYRTIHVGLLTFVTGFFSAFMNNVGALALMMPITLQSAIKTKRSPSILLMPIALGSALGGLVTLIGTPPNLLISSYREKMSGHPFSMFAYAHVGLGVAVVGIIFISFIGWRLLPTRKKSQVSEDMFQVKDYITELIVPPKSPLIDATINDFESMIDNDYIVLGIVRSNRKRLVVRSRQTIKEKDILIVEADSECLEQIINKTGLTLAGNSEVSTETLKGDDISVVEAVVPSACAAEGRSSKSLKLRARFSTNLLAIARQGKPFKERLSQVSLRAGDVVLLQGYTAGLQEAIFRFGLLPLSERNIKFTKNRFFFLPLLIFIGAITAAALHILPVQISFGGAVILMLVTNIVPPRKVYGMIEWPIIVLLAAMIPLGEALHNTGGTELITQYFMHIGTHFSPVVVLGVLMLVTMTLSDFMNNAATTVVMAPIGYGIAQALQLNSDTFLMAIAISASCSFLTPVGHQNNTLVMGPGGYRFTDYIRIGLPLEIIVLASSLPLLLHYWPLK